MSRPQPQTGDALLIVDLQNDFLPGGALPVADGDKVIPKLNEWIDTFAGTNLPIFATRDWHPATHCSFKEQGGSWPPHCIVGSHGAEAPAGLHLPENAIIIRKPSAPERETYSGFEGTELASKLRESGVQRLFIGGLATDYCVLHTVLGALERGFHVVLLRDAIRPVNVRPEDGQNAEAEMIRKGAVPIDHEGGVHE